MVSVIVQTDVLINIYSFGGSRVVGLSSKYANVEHPGTNKKIEGWKWDERTWPTEEEFDAVSVAPSIWDPILQGLPEANFKSGYGDNDDLLFLDVIKTEISGGHHWSPKVQHGHFFVHDEEWYLYADCYQTEIFKLNNVISGQQYLDLSYNYKPTIPIKVRRYNFNKVIGRHLVELDFRKRVDMETSGTSPEFTVDTTTSPPRILLNGIWSDTVGSPIVLVDGLADSSDIYDLELLGISDGTANQQFYFESSPIDPEADIEVWTYLEPTAPTSWDIVSGVEPFTTTGYQVKLDRDEGTLQFGDYDSSTEEGNGQIPDNGYRVGVHYTKGMSVQYEPDFGKDHLIAQLADVNPVASLTHAGFIQISTKPTDPYRIVLTSDLPTGSNHHIEIGNNIGRMTATVYDAVSNKLEGELVYFEITEPQIGSFTGVQTETSALSNVGGEATVSFASPTDVEDFGIITKEVVYSGPDTYMTYSGVVGTAEEQSVFIYKVHNYDEILGIPSSGLEDFYTDYLTEEGIVSGIVATQDWEEEYRSSFELATPTVYEEGELEVGKKTILLTDTLSDVVNPHSGNFMTNGYAPLYPSEIEDISTDDDEIVRLVFSNLHLPLIGQEDTKGYFIVRDRTTNIRAYVYNTRTGKTVYSNTLPIDVNLSDTFNGTYFASLLENTPSGLLTKTQDISDEIEYTDAEILTTAGFSIASDTYNKEKEYTPASVDIRAKAGAGTINATISLYEDINGSDVLIASWTVTGTTNYKTEQLKLSKAELTRITDFGNLFIRILADSADFYISWIQFKIRSNSYRDEITVSPISSTPNSGWLPLVDSYTGVNEIIPDDSDYMYSQAVGPTDLGFDDIDITSFDDYDYVQWFRNTRRGDSTFLEEVDMGISDVNVTETGEGRIPLGFRLKGRGVEGSLTAASLLDQITYIDPNQHLPSGYFEV